MNAKLIVSHARSRLEIIRVFAGIERDSVARFDLDAPEDGLHDRLQDVGLRVELASVERERRMAPTPRGRRADDRPTA
ncbi:hypothetical protein [Phycisphaera mikurensis]|uniref:Uncharacterized protein n=1 Tax=Phycisphaera mikurensis (strain NBRC 102666 / KCTC 22515 / FYK2301M01) TaxID=1142394 RepID=I0IJK5_PHYMF|nr:hypothetical protein [Phycisphaera mikurensis]MBB6443192.1 hypothetical protein [Phycisphaera mikurensis]BAM05443.1 hypothetical protein PSMK_p00810 [Phycisphaera mikurensis NBRC 102666]